MTEPFQTPSTDALPAALTDLGGHGAGPAEIADALGWSRRRLRAAADGRTHLADTLERARDAELAWWEARARTGVAERPNATLWGRVMAGRFASEGYGRAVEPTAPVETPEPVDMMRRRAQAVAALLNKMKDADAAEAKAGADAHKR